MSWSQIEKKHQERYNRDFILCREQEERNFLVNAILDVFNFISRDEVEKTFDHFCSTSVQPAERALFLARIKEHLGRLITTRYVQRYEHY